MNKLFVCEMFYIVVFLSWKWNHVLKLFEEKAYANFSQEIIRKNLY